MPIPIPLSVTEVFGRTVVTFPSEIDLCNASSIRTQVKHLLDDGAGPLILDLTATRFCDCSGVGAIVGIENHALLLGRRTCLVLPAAGPVRKIADVTGLSRRFLVASGLIAAHAGLRPKPYAPPLAGLDV